MVGFKQTKHPAEVAKVIDYFAQVEQYAKLMALTDNVPANKTVAEPGRRLSGRLAAG